MWNTDSHDFIPHTCLSCSAPPLNKWQHYLSIFLSKNIGITFDFWLFLHQSTSKPCQAHQQNLFGIPPISPFLYPNLSPSHHYPSPWTVPPNWSHHFDFYLPTFYSSHLGQPSDGFSLNLPYHKTQALTNHDLQVHT